MKLFIEILRLIINKFILRKSNGECVHIFCTHMGLVYIKLGQILAVQNINNLFTEDDRQKLISICVSCNTIEFIKYHFKSIIRLECENTIDKMIEHLKNKEFKEANRLLEENT